MRGIIILITGFQVFTKQVISFLGFRNVIGGASMSLQSGPAYVHVQPLTGPNASKGTKSKATIPRAGNMKGGDGMGGGSNLKNVIWRIILIHLLFFIFNLISHNIIFI